MDKQNGAYAAVMNNAIAKLLLACVVMLVAFAIIPMAAWAEEGASSKDAQALAFGFLGDNGDSGLLQNGESPQLIAQSLKAGDMGLTQEQIDGVTEKLKTSMANMETFTIDFGDYDVDDDQFTALFNQVKRVPNSPTSDRSTMQAVIFRISSP